LASQFAFPGEKHHDGIPGVPSAKVPVEECKFCELPVPVPFRPVKTRIIVGNTFHCIFLSSGLKS